MGLIQHWYHEFKNLTGPYRYGCSIKLWATKVKQRRVGLWEGGGEAPNNSRNRIHMRKGGVVVGAKQESYWGVQSKGVFGTNALFNSILPPATLLFPLIFFAANRKAPVIPQCLAWQNSSITKSTFLNSFYKKTTFYLWLSNWWSSPVQDYWLFDLYRQMVNKTFVLHYREKKPRGKLVGGLKNNGRWVG